MKTDRQHVAATKFKMTTFLFLKIVHVLSSTVNKIFYRFMSFANHCILFLLTFYTGA